MGSLVSSLRTSLTPLPPYPIVLVICSKLGMSMNILNIDTCPLCGKTHFEGSHDLRTITPVKIYDFTAVRRVVLFTQHVPDESEIGRYYESRVISHTDTRGHQPSVSTMPGFMLGRKASLIERICGANGSLLDIGTGTGVFQPFHAETDGRFCHRRKSGHGRLPRAFRSWWWRLRKRWRLTAKGFDVITLWRSGYLRDKPVPGSDLPTYAEGAWRLVEAVPNPVSFDAQHWGDQAAMYRGICGHLRLLSCSSEFKMRFYPDRTASDAVWRVLCFHAFGK